MSIVNRQTGGGSGGGAVATPVVNHSGTISADETWAGDTIHNITDTIMIADGKVVTVEAGAVVNMVDDSEVHLGTTGNTGYNVGRAAIVFRGTRAKRVTVNGLGTGNSFQGNGGKGNYYANGIEGYFTDFVDLDAQTLISSRNNGGTYLSHTVMEECTWTRCNNTKFNPVGEATFSFRQCEWIDSVGTENIRCWNAANVSGAQITLENCVFDAGLLVTGENLRVVDCCLITSNTYIPNHEGVVFSGCLLVDPNPTSASQVVSVSFANSSILLDECVIWGGVQQLGGNEASSSITCINSVLIGSSASHEHFAGGCNLTMLNNVCGGTVTEGLLLDFGNMGQIGTPRGRIEFNTFFTNVNYAVYLNHLGTGTNSQWATISNNVFANIKLGMIYDELTGNNVGVLNCDNNVFYEQNESTAPSEGLGTDVSGYSGNLGQLPGFLSPYIFALQTAQNVHTISQVRNARAMSRAMHTQAAAAVGSNLMTAKAGCTDSDGNKMSLA